MGVEGAPPHAAPDWREKTTHTWVQTFFICKEGDSGDSEVRSYWDPPGPPDVNGARG